MTSANDAPGTEEKVAARGEVYTLPKKTDGNPANLVPKDKTLVDRLKRKGLDPQKLLDLALPTSTAKTVAKVRHRLIIIGFILCVLLPSAAFSVYMFFWASDQYHSTAAFAVRTSQATAATDVLGMVMGSAGGESTASNSYIVSDYIQSQALLEDLPVSIDLQTIFNRDGADWLFAMGQDLPIEDQLSYWNGMVDVSYDSTSGVIYLEVRTFDPQDSVLVAQEILDRSENLVNKLSETNRRQMVRFAEEAVARAEARLKAIRKQMTAYRQETQEVSPEENAKIAAEMIAGLDQERAATEAQKKTLMSYLDEDSPRIRMLDEQISALKSEIASVRSRMGVGGGAGAQQDRRSSLSLRIADYSDLALEEEFAQQMYVTALASLEKARQDADSKSMYLATFIKPTLSEDAQYPGRILYSIAVFFMLAGFWVVAVLMYYNVRDRT